MALYGIDVFVGSGTSAPSLRLALARAAQVEDLSATRAKAR